jgi:hypothetical protein
MGRRLERLIIIYTIVLRGRVAMAAFVGAKVSRNCNRLSHLKIPGVYPEMPLLPPQNGCADLEVMLIYIKVITAVNAL